MIHKFYYWGSVIIIMRVIDRYITASILVVAATTASAAPATGDIAAAACVSCHRADGAGDGDGGIPALAQLPQKYFTKQIADFRAGTRTTAKDLSVEDVHTAAGYYVSFMKSVAKSISDEDAVAAARYYESLPRPKIQVRANVDPAVIARGEKLAVNGAWDRQVPPCFKCHAVDGRGVAPNFPPIAGQHASYIVSQLQAWKTGARTNDPQKLMKATAENLTDDEIRAVAEYLAALGSKETK